jgi:hypothetical protein
MTNQNTDVEVIVTVRLGDKTKTFIAEASAPNGGHRVTNGMINGLAGDATAWVNDQRYTTNNR